MTVDETVRLELTIEEAKQLLESAVSYDARLPQDTHRGLTEDKLREAIRVAEEGSKT